MGARVAVRSDRRRPVAWVVATLLAALLAGVAVAGCGSGGIGGDTGPATEVDASGPVKGQLTISQWPLYIDPGKNGTVAEFESTTGVDVKYIEDINDNSEFFGKMQPLLAKGDRKSVV